MREKVRQRLHEVGLATDEDMAYLWPFLGVQDDTPYLEGMRSETLKARTIDVLCQMSLKRSRQQPVILVVEDLHWIDQSSEDFFLALVESLASCCHPAAGDVSARLSATVDWQVVCHADRPAPSDPG